MDHRELKRLVQLMNANELVELEIEQEGMRVSLKKACSPAGAALPVAPPVYAAPVATPIPGTIPGAVPGTIPGAPPGTAMPGGGGPAPATPVEEEAPRGTELILSPMVGTFYRRPSADADPYVEVGTVVDEESVICIVEAMKVNNELKAERQGTILEILVEDGQPVEYDQPLFRLKAG